MNKVLWKLLLYTTIPVLCGLAVVNAYLVWKNLRLIQKSTTSRVEASEIQEAISHVAFDLQTMETSQRGYLLTGDVSYLKPYDAANERLARHFSELRARLTESDRSLEAQIESITEAKIEEMKETIRLRQQGYRHRAFLIVGSNRGQELMEKARASLAALSSAQAGNAARYEGELQNSIRTAFRQSAYANAALLLLAAIALVAFHRYRTRLELEYARHDEELRQTALQLKRLNAMIFQDFRPLQAEIQRDADALLEGYGDFLPRQGHQRVERIRHGAGQMIGLLDGLSNTPPAVRNDVARPPSAA